MDSTNEAFDDATCSYCLELFTEPRNLHCGHTFCTLCLQDLAKKPYVPHGTIICPNCDYRTLLDFRNVLGLTKNLQLANAADRARRGMTSSTVFSMPQSIRFHQDDIPSSLSTYATPSSASSSPFGSSPTISSSIFLPPMPVSIPVAPSLNPTPLYFDLNDIPTKHHGDDDDFEEREEGEENQKQEPEYLPELTASGDGDDTTDFYCIPDSSPKSERTITSSSSPSSTTSSPPPPPPYHSAATTSSRPSLAPATPLIEDISPSTFAYFKEVLSLEDMGFTERALNADLLLQFSGDLNLVISALVSGVTPENPVFTATPTQSLPSTLPLSPLPVQQQPQEQGQQVQGRHQQSHLQQQSVHPSPVSPTSSNRPQRPSSSSSKQITRSNSNGYSSTIQFPTKEQQGGVFSLLKRMIWDDSDPNRSRDPSHINFAEFKISSSDASENFLSWTTGLYFAPANFARDLKFQGSQPLYVPFWLFQANTFSTCSADMESVERTNSYRELMACALLDSDERDIVSTIHDWDLTEVRNAPQPMQSAFKAPHDWEAIWKEFVEKDVTKQEEQHIESEWRARYKSKPRRLEIKVNFPAIERQLVFFPIYLGNYHYANNNYRVVVNGQTGSVQGQRPYGTGKLGAVGYAGLSLLGRSIWGGGGDGGPEQQQQQQQQQQRGSG